MYLEKIEVTQVVVSILLAFKLKSYQSYELLTIREEEYNDLLNDSSINLRTKIIKDYQDYKAKSKSTFNLIIDKGERKNIDWTNIMFDGFLAKPEISNINDISKIERKIINGHLGLRFLNRPFTIFGIQLVLINEGYKLNSIEICGLFEVELMDYYLDLDEMYLEQLEDEGY